MQIPRAFALLTLVATLAATLIAVPSCAPRSTGVQARLDANKRYELTTSLVSFDQAKQAFESGELDKARKECETAIARSSTQAKYWSLLGRIELEAKKLERAVNAFAKSIECDPTLAEPFYYRGIVQQRWGAFAKATEDYLKASELAPDKVSYLLAAAEIMITERKLDDARMLLVPKLAYFEHNAAIHELLGEIALMNDDFTTAARSYERAIIIDPEAPLVAEKLVSAYFSAGEYQKCLEAARRQRSIAAKDANGQRVVVPNEVFRNEGRSLAMLGRMSDARAVFVEQSRAYPEDADCWRDLATAALASNDVPRAAQASERLVALSADDSSGYTLRGIVAEREQKYDEAVRWHRLAVARAPTNVDTLIALGVALQSAGRQQESLEVLGKAIKLDPQSALARKAFAGAVVE